MSWVHLVIAIGYLVVLLAIMGLLHGAVLVYRDLRSNRSPEDESHKSLGHPA